jgi:hypothetical protein
MCELIGEMKYFCDPAWHEQNKKVPADYFILVLPEDRHAIALPHAYAACAQHLQQALEIMLERPITVSIRRVNRE